ncbi:autotransporter outer membrane beta-barrel domain-containing protein [Pseudomonas yamanorum]
MSFRLKSISNTPFTLNTLAFACSLVLPVTAVGSTQLIADGEDKEVSGQTYEHSNQYQYAMQASNGGSILAEDITAIAHSNGGYGILSRDAGSNITFKGGSITTDGRDGDAVTAADKGNVVLEGVEIRTTGRKANGVTSNDGTVKISNSVINAEGGDYSTGLVAENGGHISAENIDVNAARGILVYSGGQIDGTGLKVLTTESTGVRVDSGGVVNLDNSSVETTGEFSVAFEVSAGGKVKLNNVQIKTDGDASAGAFIDGENSYLNINSGSISTVGEYSTALSISDRAITDAQNLDVVTTGYLSAGLFAGSEATLNFNNGSVKTSGLYSSAVVVYGAAEANISQSNLITTGDSSHGLNISSEGGVIHLRGSTVDVEGEGSNAINSNIFAGGVGKFDISDSVLNAEQGAAIEIIGAGHTDIELKKSSIESAAGELFSSSFTSGSSSVLADASNLKGDIFVRSADFDADFTLKNGSFWAGAGNGIDTLSLAGSGWRMTGDSTVRNLSLDSGNVSFDYTDSLFKTLTTETLSGNGRFFMNTDLATEQGDLLVVQGAGMASGDHQIVVSDSGHEPANGNGRLKLVDTNGGDAKFDLYGEHVDAGAFRYGLQQDGDDWVLARIGSKPTEELSKGANAAVAAHSASAGLWSAQMNSLVKRLGELRMGKDDGGVWTRGISKRFDVSESSSRAYTQNISGIEIGADKAITLDTGKVYIGAMVGTASAKLNFGEGASGNTDSKLLGVYATYLNESGIYVDTVLKHSQFDNDIKMPTNLGAPVKSSYKTHGVGMDIEVGKKIKLGDGWFVEPQLEITATRTQGGNYTASNGLRVKSDDLDSLQSRVGSLFGRSLELSNGMKAQPYVKASYITEHAGSSTVSVNGNKIDAEIPGNRVELGFGGILQVSEKSKISFDAEYAKGNSIEQPWGVNIGYRYLW